MMKKQLTHSKQQLFLSGVLLLLMVALAACGDTLDRIGDRREPTTSPVFQRTATPGGVISVWMVSPTGQAIDTALTPDNGTPRGEVVGPAASATALIGTLTAATQTAAAPPSLPNFQPSNCPLPSGRVPEPRPDSFAQFPAAIGTYLSEGGPTAVLESELQNWGAITPQGGHIQADSDLTGDGVNEILVTLFNPFIYNEEATLNSGQMLIYGCDNGGYRLLFASATSPGLSIPLLYRVGDMNGDIKAEVVYNVKSCTFTYCLGEGQILTWSTVTGSFEPMNASPIITVNGKIGILDIDGDGILELRAESTTPPVLPTEQPKRIVDIWDWTGRNYVLALRED